MEEIDLKDFIRTAWNRKLHIFIILVIFAVIGVIYTTQLIVPKYTSSTRLILASSRSATDSLVSDVASIDKDITLNSKLVPTYSELIKSKSNLRQVKANLGIEIDEDALRKKIKVSAVEDTEIIVISVTDYDSEMACDIANEIASVFMDRIKDIYDLNNVQVVDEAEISSEPSNINHKKDVVIFVFLGMLVSMVYVFVLNMLDTTVKSVEEIEHMTGIVCLAGLPLYDANNKKKGRKN